MPWVGDRLFKVRNSGDIPINFTLSTTNNTMEGVPVTIEPGITRQRKVIAQACLGDVKVRARARGNL